MNRSSQQKQAERLVRIPTGAATLEGDLHMPADAVGIVLFAHGSGSSRHSPRNRHVAQALRDSGLATLLLDLLTEEEEVVDMATRHLRFDIDMLAQRLVEATDWLRRQPDTRPLPIGYFGASTGAGAALVAAATRPEDVGAVVSRGGRPDLAMLALTRVQAPTLFIVGGSDTLVVSLNQQAQSHMSAPTRMEVVAGASHLFDEPGALEEVARLAAEWFVLHLKR